MSNPIDIKLAHINKIGTTSNVLSRDAIYDILNRTNSEALIAHYKFQQIWVHQVYETFKDFDTYLILMYLKNTVFIDYSDRFIT